MALQVGVGCKAEDLCEKKNVAKYKQVNPVSNLAECPMEGYGSKRADLPIMTIIPHVYDGIIHLHENAQSRSAIVTKCLNLEDSLFESRLF
jgi:hypothetical protein